MKLIIPPSPTVEAFFPRVSLQSGNGYRLTTLCVRIECPDGILLYHTLTGALVLLEAGESIDVENEELIRFHFVVEKDFEENRFSRDLQKIMGLTRAGSGTVTSYTILTTTDCNARCFYCYEKGIRRFAMSEKTASDVAEFIVRSCGGNRVSLHWFGGEPLMNTRAVNIICRRLIEANIEFSSKIITNGYLFDEKMIVDAKRFWRLKHAHITLDGTKEVYQRTKAYVNGDDMAFERVLDNVDALTDNNISVMLRLNLNRDNYEDIMRLCDQLGERFGGKRGIRASAVLLRDHVCDVHSFTSEERGAFCYRSVQDKLKSFGLLHVAPLVQGVRINACMADSESSIVINPDGTLGKCEHYNENEIIGSIYSEKRDSEITGSWKRLKADHQLCSDCPLYPQCIRLEKCPNAKDDCTRTKQMLKIDNLMQSIKKTYRDRKNEGK